MSLDFQLIYRRVSVSAPFDINSDQISSTRFAKGARDHTQLPARYVPEVIFNSGRYEVEAGLFSLC